jgi:hypothetical protein
MSRGLGARQQAILLILARYRYQDFGDDAQHGMLVDEIALQFGADARESVAARSSIRRALATMRSAGLVDWDYWYPKNQGQPRRWKITYLGSVRVALYMSETEASVYMSEAERSMPEVERWLRDY